MYWYAASGSSSCLTSSTHEEIWFGTATAVDMLPTDKAQFLIALPAFERVSYVFRRSLDIPFTVIAIEEVRDSAAACVKWHAAFQTELFRTFFTVVAIG